MLRERDGAVWNAPGRTVILHYHLFKNAGTSFDHVLRRNFPQAWASREFPGPPARRAPGLAQWIAGETHIRAFSSHTALLPVPAVAGTRILPAIFVRHPIDRLRSAYRFETRQNADTYGAKLAKRADFAGYVAERLANPKDVVCRNFQARRLAMALPSDRRELGVRAVEAAKELPFVGLVEAFDASVDRFADCASALGVAFTPLGVRKNTGEEAGLGLEERLFRARAELGTALFENLCAENAADLKLFEFVQEQY